MALDGLRVVFIDDGGVLNDNEARAPQWRRLLGEYMPPRYGGTPQAWERANVDVFARSWDRYLAQVERAGTSGGVEAWTREERGRWLAEMCEHVGVAVPPDPVTRAIEAATWVSERVRSAIPGAIDAVHALGERGLTLHTASGGLSWELAPYLGGMGIRERFDHLYGPDLVDRYKNGAHYYAAILSHSRADPATSAVVEDSEKGRAWAASVGLRTFASLAALREAME